MQTASSDANHGLPEALHFSYRCVKVTSVSHLAMLGCLEAVNWGHHVHATPGKCIWFFHLQSADYLWMRKGILSHVPHNIMLRQGEPRWHLRAHGTENIGEKLRSTLIQLVASNWHYPTSFMVTVALYSWKSCWGRTMSHQNKVPTPDIVWSYDQPTVQSMMGYNSSPSSTRLPITCLILHLLVWRELMELPMQQKRLLGSEVCCKTGVV